MPSFPARLGCFAILACALIANSAVSAAIPVPSYDDSPAPVTKDAPGMVEEPDAPEDNDIPQKGEEPLSPLPPAVTTPPHKAPTSSAPAAPNADQDAFQTVVLRVLNKVTARTQEIEAPVGSVMRSGTIEIIAHTCRKSAPDQPPEDAALLEISEEHQGEAPTRIFLGWMFSSSPAISALEHPFYDVTLISCRKTSGVQ